LHNEKTLSNIFTNHDRLNIYYRHSRADDERACVVIAHGLGEHSGRYTHVIDRLVSNGISVWAMDHQGFGKSDGKRGHILSFKKYTQDLRQMIKIAKEDMSGGINCFLLGHSMGGLMVLYFAMMYTDLINGVIASSPGLQPAMKVPKVKGALGKIMSGIWPTLTFDSELDSSHLSHDKTIAPTYDSDPLVHRKVSSRWFTEYLAAMDKTTQSAARLSIPVLLQVAGDDRIVDANASKQFFENISSIDKTLYVYDGLYHEIYNELDDDRENVLADLDRWIDDHI